MDDRGSARDVSGVRANVGVVPRNVSGLLRNVSLCGRTRSGLDDAGVVVAKPSPWDPGRCGAKVNIYLP